MALSVYLGTKKATARGREHYIEIIPKEPNFQRVADEFLYVNDPVSSHLKDFFRIMNVKFLFVSFFAGLYEILNNNYLTYL